SLVVDPFLYLGSEEVPLAHDAVDQLVALGITHVINMAVEVCSQNLLKGGQQKCMKFMLEDRADQDVDQAVKEAISFIAKAREESSRNKVLVHCRAGKSRSATVVIGFLIVHGRMTLDGATKYVRQRRSNISPNIGFWVTLQRLEKEAASLGHLHDDVPQF
ncbi:protein-tyrosine phosphatase-like protein, partial [Cladochytrium replicatum]